MHTNLRPTAATIFSRVSAPPPPLIIAPHWVTSSAPSMYTGTLSTLLSSSTSMPQPFRRALDFSELDTAPLMRPLILASSSMKKLAVVPDPTPTHESVTTYLIASRATACLSSSWVIRSRDASRREGLQDKR